MSHPTDAALTSGKSPRQPSVDEDIRGLGETGEVDVCLTTGRAHLGVHVLRHLELRRIVTEQEGWRMIEVGLLGSIVVQVDDNRVDLAGVLEKALLARLSINPGSTVSQSRLIDDLWGESLAHQCRG